MTRIILFTLAIIAGCSNDYRPITDYDAEARTEYPDLTHLYAGEHGIYRGCGPNGGVCHNSNEFPNLSSMGSIIANVDVVCNQKRDNPAEIHDLCERPGDLVDISGERIEIGYIEPYMNIGYRMVLRKKPQALAPTGETFGTYRTIPDDDGGTTVLPFVPLSLAFPAYLPDPDDASGRSILFAGPPPPGDQVVAAFMAESGIGRGDRLLFGDPNRDGVFGAELGGRLIKPGEPERSYLLRRLTDPTVGPLMPRANCCSWTKTSLRALWCWVDGLVPDGSNATDPIDYDHCSASPPIDLLYPTPGPMCEAQGLCPVQAAAGTGEATFGSIYAEILTARCAGSECHDNGDPGGVDFTSIEAAFETLSTKVVPGDPAASVLWQRLSPELCTGECETMPLGRPALEDEDLDRIREWIEAGAAND